MQIVSVMALVTRFLKLQDHDDTHVFTFVGTKSVTRDLDRDITSKDFRSGDIFASIQRDECWDLKIIEMIKRNKIITMVTMMTKTITSIYCSIYSALITFTVTTSAQGSSPPPSSSTKSSPSSSTCSLLTATGITSGRSAWDGKTRP